MCIAAKSDLFLGLCRVYKNRSDNSTRLLGPLNLISNILTPDPYALSTAYANRLLQGQEVNQRENAERAGKEPG
jgi:hypothetical protein